MFFLNKNKIKFLAFGENKLQVTTNKYIPF